MSINCSINFLGGILFSININASSIVNSVGSFSSGIVAFNDLYLIYGPY